MKRALFILIGLAVSASATMVAAQTSTNHQAVDQGREAFGSSTDFPWYDSEHDALRRIDVHPPKDLAARKSKWQTQQVNWSFSQAFIDVMKVILKTLGWILFALLLFGVIYLLTRAAMIESWRGRGESSTPDDPLHGDVDRIESLPFQLQRPQEDLLAAARRLYEAGNYAQAIVYLYSYQLIQLDRHQLIRLTKGKTNRQYLREVRPRRALFDVLYRSMVAFEDVFFGRHSLDRERFESCWGHLDEFHQLLNQAAA